MKRVAHSRIGFSQGREGRLCLPTQLFCRCPCAVRPSLALAGSQVPCAVTNFPSPPSPKPPFLPPKRKLLDLANLPSALRTDLSNSFSCPRLLVPQTNNHHHNQPTLVQAPLFNTTSNLPIILPFHIHCRSLVVILDFWCIFSVLDSHQSRNIRLLRIIRCATAFLAPVSP